MGVYVKNNNYNKRCLYTGVMEHESNQLHLTTDLNNRSSLKVISFQFVGTGHNKVTNQLTN